MPGIFIKSKNKIHLQIFALFVASLISVVFNFASISVITLNENQLLYLFSSMSQIIGSMFGLSLTAFVFFVDKFKESAKIDETYYEATNSLLKNYFIVLKLISVICGGSLFFSISGIIILHNFGSVYPIVIDEAVILFAFGVFKIIEFGIMLLDPDKLDKEISAMINNAKSRFKDISSKKDAKINYATLADFLKAYNILQNILVEFAELFIEEEGDFFKVNRPQILQALSILNIKEIVNRKIIDEINEFRLYRNGLVHGTDFDISQSLYDRLVKISAAIGVALEAIKKFGPKSKEYLLSIKTIYNL